MKSAKLFTCVCYIFAFSFFSLNAQAQFVDVPKVVISSFDKKFPDAKEVDWQHNIGKPEVKFKVDGKSHWARFTNKGVWEVTSIKINMDELPSEVVDGFHKSKYSEWPVKEVNKVEKPDGVTYKINISKAALNSKSLVFSEKGKLLKD